MLRLHEEAISILITTLMSICKIIGMFIVFPKNQFSQEANNTIDPASTHDPSQICTHGDSKGGHPPIISVMSNNCSFKRKGNPARACSNLNRPLGAE